MLKLCSKFEEEKHSDRSPDLVKAGEVHTALRNNKHSALYMITLL